MTGRRRMGRRLADLRRLDAYAAPEREDGITTRLDTNENLAVPKSISQGALATAKKNADVRQYPDDSVRRLRDALAKLARVSPSNIIVGNGSDQILDLLLAHMIGHGASVLTTDPTFAFFEARCAIHGVKMTKVPFSDEMTMPVGRLEAASRGADAIYLDSPNNPTGFQFSESRIQRLARSFDGLVIVDEAYAEFGRYGLSRPRENLIIVRTLSKSFGLAGLRVGYAIAPRALAEAFSDVIQYPYPISTVSAEAAIAALCPERIDAVSQTINAIKSERARIIDGLSAHDALEVFNSEANFVLFDAGAAYMRIHTALAEQGISIRAIGAVGDRKGCLRVTVGTRDMNSRFLLAVRDLMC